MKKFLFLPLLSLATVALATTTAYSPPVGGMTLTAAANTDTLVSAALVNPAAWVGTVASISGSDITVAGTPSWTAGAFIPPTASGYYYARMLSGSLQGQYFSIAANGTGDITVDAAGLNLSTIAAGDTMEIVPYWTLATLYPAGQAGVSFIATQKTNSIQTQILFFDSTSVGINRSASSVYFFLKTKWVLLGGDITQDAGNTIIYPDAYVIQRNTASPTTLVYTGRVQPGFLGTVITATSGTANDNFVALAFPVDVTLNASGLAASGFVPTTKTNNIQDQLLWFDPAGTGINRSAAATYFYFKGSWVKVGDLTDHGADLLKAGSGFIIRKAANGSSTPWVFSTGI